MASAHRDARGYWLKVAHLGSKAIRFRNPLKLRNILSCQVLVGYIVT